MTLVLATRGSALARWQAEAAREALAALDAAPPAELVIVRSSGDLDQESLLARFGRIGIFTVEVDRALLEGRADVAVHSLKDMTTELQEGVVLGGVLPRGPVEDALVSRSGAPLAELPHGARVATGSQRRAALLRHVRPDLEIVPARGNVETRLAKLGRGDADALVLARAGLVRLGLAGHIAEVLPAERFVPAVGQGIVGLTCRADDERALALLGRVRDDAAWAAALAERALLRGLRGGCNACIGAHARLAGARLELRACVLSPSGDERLDDALEGDAAEPEAIGLALARRLTARGASRLVEAGRA